MESRVARTAHTISRSWSSAVAGIWRNVGGFGSLSSSVLQCRSYSDEGLDGRVPPTIKASLAINPVVNTPLSGKFPPTVPETQTFGADRPVYGRNAYPPRNREGFRDGVPNWERLRARVSLARLKPQLTRTAQNEEENPLGSCVDRNAYPPRKGKGFRVGLCIAMCKPQLSWTALNKNESAASNWLRASNNVALDSGQDSPRLGFVYGKKELPMGSACGDGNIHISKAIAILKNRQQQGISIAPYTFVEVLKRCSNQKDLIAARQVHDCIIQSGMNKNPYVANSLLTAYVKCGRLVDARRVFDGLEKKTNFTWSIMIGGYAKNGHAEDALEVFNGMRQGGAQPDELLCLSILKACASPSAFKCGKEVHAYIRHAGLESDVRVGTALVQMYARCGCITEARQVFEKLGSNRNIITWNVMIGAYTERGCGLEAYRLFLQMQREGLIPNAVTYVSILNASARAGALEWVKEVHSHALKAGLESDLRVGNVLVHMYAKSGSIDHARMSFDRLKTRDVITWNIMIGAYAESGCGVEAYRLFLQMQREGFIPNSVTYVSILNASASAGALEWVKEVHNHALKAGLESDLRVGNVLVHMYAKSGSIDDARMIFDRLKTRDVITWNTMIGAYAESGCGVEAYRLFQQMKREGFIPNAITCVSILNASASAGALEWIKEVHSHAIKAGLGSDLRVGNALVHMYAKCGCITEARRVFENLTNRNVITSTLMIGAYAANGCIEDARRVFDKTEKRDIIIWNTMIGAYAGSGCGVEAYRLFLQMQREGFIPDAATCVSILNGASASAGALEWVKEVHSHALKAGLESDLRVGNVLVHMHAKSGSIEDARLIFDRLKTRDVVSWNIMIGAYAESGCGVEAYRLFLEMQRKGFIPDAITYVSILNASASAGDLEWVKEVHRHALKAGLESDLRVGNGLIHMYAKSGSIDDSRLIFERMERSDVVTWNTMIGALAQHGCGHEALELFRKMSADTVKPDAFSFVAILSACGHTGLLDDGRRLFSAMTQHYGILPDVVHYTCMVDLLGRAGHLEEAKLLIDDMSVEPDAVIWKALLGACRTHGNVELGELAFKELLNLEPMDSSTYVLLSHTYAAAGKWEDVSSVRTMMQNRGVRKEPGRSWIEVDNKIHNFVVGDTCHPEKKAIYAQLHELNEKLKAAGYTPHTQLVLQDIDEKDKELAICSHSEKLAIAYGLMHIPPGKPIRVYKNLRVCSDCHTATKFISKVTGREIIARDGNRFHHFKDGVCSCGDYW